MKALSYPEQFHTAVVEQIAVLYRCSEQDAEGHASDVFSEEIPHSNTVRLSLKGVRLMDIHYYADGTHTTRPYTYLREP